ncbi:MAG: metallophosphoesterase, partial [Candidatus Heimdallarchaeaceae archaeon]
MRVKKLQLFIITFILLVSPFLGGINGVFAEDIPPGYIHLSWQNDNLTTMTFTWRTAEITGSIVQYGIQDVLENEVSGIDAIWHVVEATNLQSDTVYKYRVGNGESWSDEYNFKTGRSDGARFIAWGDSRTNRDERVKIVNAVSKINYEFSVFDGDLVGAGREIGQWYDWLKDFTPAIRETPFMPVLGNHEKNHSHYYNIFSLPGREEFYSFNYGPVHFVALHTCVEDYGGSLDEQAEWLRNDLDAHSEYPWTIVVQHRPPYSSSVRYHNGDTEDLLTTLVPIYEEYGVDMVIAGHDHWYERLESNNVSYVVAGSSGAPLYSLIPAYAINESIYAESVYHAIYIETYENQLAYQAFRGDHSTIDKFYINKVSKPDLRVESLPLNYDFDKNETKDITITIANVGEVNITEETSAKVEIFNNTYFDLTVPALDVSEAFNYTFAWTAP